MLQHSIKREGRVIDLFSDIQTKFSLFDPQFLKELVRMKVKNLAVKLLKKLIIEHVSLYWRTNLVKSEKFSEIIRSSRAGMRKLIKRLLREHKYPLEGMQDAVKTIMNLCKIWADCVMQD